MRSNTAAMQDSAVTEGCRPISLWLKLCENDFAAVVGILFFVWYIIWGVPWTLRLVSACKRALLRVRTGFRTRDRYYSRPIACADVERSAGSQNSAYQDPYFSPTRQLQAFLARTTTQNIPPPSPALDMRDTLRLKQYRFPPGSGAPFPALSPEGTPQSDGGFFDLSSYPDSDSDSNSDASFSSGSQSSPGNRDQSHAKRTTYEELDGVDALVMDRRSRPRPGSGASFDTIGFVDIYSYADSRRNLLAQDRVEEQEDASALPESPPPAYVDLQGLALA